MSGSSNRGQITIFVPCQQGCLEFPPIILVWSSAPASNNMFMCVHSCKPYSANMPNFCCLKSTENTLKRQLAYLKVWMFFLWGGYCSRSTATKVSLMQDIQSSKAVGSEQEILLFQSHWMSNMAQFWEVLICTSSKTMNSKTDKQQIETQEDALNAT